MATYYLVKSKTGKAISSAETLGLAVSFRDQRRVRGIKGLKIFKVETIETEIVEEDGKLVKVKLHQLPDAHHNLSKAMAEAFRQPRGRDFLEQR